MGGDDVRESYFLSDEQIDEINSQLEKDIENAKGKAKIQKIKKNLVWRVMLDSAGRRRAIVNIKVKNIDFERGLILDNYEKGGKIVDFVISDYTMELIKRFIEIENLSGDNYLFHSYNDKNKPLAYNSLAIWVKEIGTIVNIPNFYPHSIRKTRINQICDKFGLDIASSYANHKRTKVTKDHYVKPKTSIDLRNLVLSIKK